MNSTRRNWGDRLVALSLFVSLFSLASCSGGGGGLGSASPGGGSSGNDSSDSGSTNPFAGLEYYTGAHLATLEVEAPNLSEFLLHGTVPLPASTYPSADGKKTFAVLDYDETPILATQVEIVSRYANASQGADIVEIRARVRRDPVLSAGMRLQYRVVELFYENGVPAFEDVDALVQSTLNLPSSIRSLVQNPNSVQLRSRDVFGNEYSMDLLNGAGSTTVLQKGATTVQWRHFGALTPVTAVTGATATLSQLMSVHSYPRVSLSDPVLQLDLRVSNGSIGANPAAPTPLSKMYFRDLEIRMPKEFALIPDIVDPAFGERYFPDENTVAYPIVKANADGTMHVMPRQGQFPRRLAIVPLGQEAIAQSRLDLEGLGFVRKGMNFGTGKELYSWQNTLTSRYYPQKHPLPHYDHIGQASILSKDASNFTALSTVMQSGNPSPGGYPVGAFAMGWAHPYGSSYGGMTGGDAINLYDGQKTAYAASRNGVRYEILLLRMWNERQPTTLYRADGQPASPLDFLKQGSGFQYVPFDFFLNPNGNSGPAFFGFNVPNAHVAAVESLGKKPSYEAEFLGYSPCDVQHYVRIDGRAKVAAYLANDAMAKDDLHAYANVHWLSYHQFYNNSGKGAQGSGLRSEMTFVAANPNKGFGFGRGEAWGLDVMSVVYGMGDDTLRSNTKPWFDAVVDTVAAGQTCNGITQAFTYIKLLGGKYRTYQAFEMGIVGNALVGAFSSVYAGTSDPRVSQIQTSIVNLVKGLTGPVGWDSVKHGPRYQVAVGPNDVSLPLFCSLSELPADGKDDGIDGFQNWSNLAYAYEISKDPVYLDRAKEMGGGSTASLKAKLQFNGYGENSGNQAALLWLCQALGYF